MSLADGLASAIAQALLGSGHPVKIPELLSVRTLTGTDTLTNQARNIQRLDPGGAARNVLLPPEEDGLFYFFVNAADAAETISVKDDSNTTTVMSLAQNTAGCVYCAGTTWYKVYSGTIAL